MSLKHEVEVSLIIILIVYMRRLYVSVLASCPSEIFYVYSNCIKAPVSCELRRVAATSRQAVRGSGQGGQSSDLSSMTADSCVCCCPVPVLIL